MKIQFLNGGLANQAFQYIFAKYYELSQPGEIMYMDDSYFAINTVHNGYELGKVFGVKPHFLSQCFDEDVWSFILEQKKMGKSVPQILCENGMDMYMISEVGEGYKNFNPFYGKVISIPCNQYEHNLIKVPGDVYFHGYWINKNWMGKYRDYYIKELVFPAIEDDYNKEVLKKILGQPSVSVHIRRGDYVKLGITMENSNYREMVEVFKYKIRNTGGVESDIKNWEIFVFSDDILWCKENWRELGFDSFGGVTYVEGNVKGKNYMDMQLMSKCEAMIMSNSAFCYLAVLLNTRRKVVVNPTGREI